MVGMEQFTAYLKNHRGKQQELAKFLGLRPSTVCQWKEVPIAHVRKVSEFTGIPTQVLRPDLHAAIGSEAAE